MTGRLAAALVAMAVVPAPASAATPVDNAPVPFLCEHPAGTLENGGLPGMVTAAQGIAG